MLSLASHLQKTRKKIPKTIKNTLSKPRVAASSYLNTAPLIWAFQQGSLQDALELVTDAAPARCGDLLAQGRVEAALVPIIEYQRIFDVQIVPGVCVGSHSAVRSVILVSRHDDLSKIRSVALDSSSRTSQALIRIMFREFVGHEPKWTSRDPDIQTMLQTNDAALMIGDPAMKVSLPGIHVFDLASLWHRFTDTGFVFAMWMARAGAVDTISRVDFAGARDEGLENIEQIIANYGEDLPLPVAEIWKYLKENITFHVDETLGEGMQLYFELAQKHGLIDHNKPLEFLKL
ncbi:MAG TPA: menaquinone biosynthesis protein [Pyrinomonadaceae bacterium]|nr:menaquinone biosynthesis protein [Pyrinomonadaceae bacterium]